MSTERIFIPTQDGSITLYRPDLDESYHSRKGALQESRYVFIQHGLDLLTNSSVRLLEIGWGTGLNGILSYEWAQKTGRKLSYHTLETLPLTTEEYMPFLDAININTEWKQIWQHMHEKEWGTWVELTANFELRKDKNSIQETILEEEEYDIVFFDAFAPSKQPEMWTPEILEKCFHALSPGGILTTYCAQGQFKRNLRSIGFTVTSYPGPQGKIEMTVAERG